MLFLNRDRETVDFYKKENARLYKDFNWVYPRLQNSYTGNRNTFELINCTATMRWREPRKVVV